jgi:ABC-2 type transport system ATP-binding protein
MSLQVAELVKIYGNQRAVDNISFQVNKGEIVGFLGPNGAGKSTTMKILTGYLKADSGDAFVCGINVKENAIEVKKKIGYLPEANPLYYDMYVKEYLEFVAGVHKISNQKTKINDVVDLTGLTIESKKKIGQLSKGYKQRVGLAAALVHDPEVLILDEPTSGLDPNQIIEIRNVIKQQGKSKTVIFSSHILQEVQAICDRVVIINKGKLVADDSIQNLRQTTMQMIRVAFKEPLEPAWLQRMSSVTGLNKLDSFTWQLQTNNIHETRKQLLELSLENNLNIISLQNEGDDLEEIFRTLTMQKKAE